ncbi:hypothetical protein D3C77_228560 [compost metagenome]
MNGRGHQLDLFQLMMAVGQPLLGLAGRVRRRLLQLVHAGGRVGHYALHGRDELVDPLRQHPGLVAPVLGQTLGQIATGTGEACHHAGRLLHRPGDGACREGEPDQPGARHQHAHQQLGPDPLAKGLGTSLRHPLIVGVEGAARHLDGDPPGLLDLVEADGREDPQPIVALVAARLTALQLGQQLRVLQALANPAAIARVGGYDAHGADDAHPPLPVKHPLADASGQPLQVVEGVVDPHHAEVLIPAQHRHHEGGEQGGLTVDLIDGGVDRAACLALLGTEIPLGGPDPGRARCLAVEITQGFEAKTGRAAAPVGGEVARWLAMLTIAGMERILTVEAVRLPAAVDAEEIRVAIPNVLEQGRDLVPVQGLPLLDIARQQRRQGFPRIQRQLEGARHLARLTLRQGQQPLPGLLAGGVVALLLDLLLHAGQGEVAVAHHAEDGGQQDATRKEHDLILDGTKHGGWWVSWAKKVGIIRADKQSANGPA